MVLGSQFLDNLEQHAGRNGLVVGTPAKRAMRVLDIRPIEGRRMPALSAYGLEREYDYNIFSRRPGSTIGFGNRLYTSQTHFHLPTLRKYAESPHEWEGREDPDLGPEVPYLPHVFWDEGTNRQWIDEGHHRIMAARLNGDDVRVWRGNTIQ